MLLESQRGTHVRILRERQLLAQRYSGLYVCPHTSTQQHALHVRVRILCNSRLYVSAYWYATAGSICPHTTQQRATHMSAYYASSTAHNATAGYICVLILLLCMCPHTTTIYVSSYYYCKCVLILLYMCHHTTIYVLILLILPLYISLVLLLYRDSRPSVPRHISLLRLYFKALF